jgi:broad specificity phosphatase PhoE
MRIYFARHGESEANVLKVFANTPGRYGLTELGRVQAQALAERLAEVGITRVYASPLMRAQQTADIVCQRLGMPFETRDELIEFNVGDHEGSCDEAAWDEYREVEQAWLIEGDTKARIGGGECFEDIESRFLPFVRELMARFGDTAERPLLIGHGGTFACMLPLILANVERAFSLSHRISPAGLIVAEQCAGKLYCLQWADAEFRPEHHR